MLTEVNEGNEELVGTSFPSLPSVTNRGVYRVSSSNALVHRSEISNQRAEPMTSSAVTLLFQSGATGALLIMARPCRSAHTRSCVGS